MSRINSLESMRVSDEYYAEVDNNAFKGAEKITENTAKILRDKKSGVIVTTMFIDGSSKSAILKEAETFGVDLIIVGSHGDGVIEGFLLGSVFQAVLYMQNIFVKFVR